MQNPILVLRRGGRQFRQDCVEIDLDNFATRSSHCLTGQPPWRDRFGLSTRAPGGFRAVGSPLPSLKKRFRLDSFVRGRSEGNFLLVKAFQQANITGSRIVFRFVKHFPHYFTPCCDLATNTPS
jgi:hypothetical protein